MDLAVSQVPSLPQSLTLFLPACLHSSLNTGRPSQPEALFQAKCPLNGIKCVLVSASLGRLSDDLQTSLIVIVRCEPYSISSSCSLIIEISAQLCMEDCTWLGAFFWNLFRSDPGGCLTGPSKVL